MQSSKVRAPIPDTKKSSDKHILKYEKGPSTIDNDLSAISFNKLDSNELTKSIFVSKSKTKELRKMRRREKLLLQEERVRKLLNQINYHINQMIGNNLTIADVTGRFKPISHEFERLPTIHFDLGMNNEPGFHPNPFSAINSYHSTTSSKYSSTNDQEESSKSDLNLLSANDDLIQYNFCGHCKKHFIDGEAHRLTGMHQKIISSPKHWEKIDELLQKNS